MSSPAIGNRKKWGLFLTNLLLVLACLFAILPIATTVIISFKKQADITRNPPVLFPCDTPQKRFDLSACRWATEGYQRVFAPKPSESSPLGFVLTGKLVRIYIPNTLLYAVSTALLVMIAASLAGFVFSRYHFRGHNALMAAIMAVTGVPTFYQGDSAICVTRPGQLSAARFAGSAIQGEVFRGTSAR